MVTRHYHIWLGRLLHIWHNSNVLVVLFTYNTIRIFSCLHRIWHNSYVEIRLSHLSCVKREEVRYHVNESCHASYVKETFNKTMHSNVLNIKFEWVISRVKEAFCVLMRYVAGEGDFSHMEEASITGEAEMWHTNEYFTHRWVMSRMKEKGPTRACHKCGWVMSCAWMCHVTCTNQSWHTYE